MITTADLAYAACISCDWETENAKVILIVNNLTHCCPKCSATSLYLLATDGERFVTTHA